MYIPETFRKVAEEISSKNTIKKLSVKQLLYLFQSERRTRQNCDWISSSIKQLDLVIEPDFTNAWIHSIVKLSAVPKVKMHKKQQNIESIAIEDIYDPTPKLGLLSAANVKPITINKDASINQAITLMMINDFSQLPVMSSERKVDGLISWKSIGSANSIGKEIKLVQECMDRDVTKLDYNMPLLDAVNTVLQKEIVLVKKSDDTICGIVTSTDVGEKFVSLSEPFLILEQIENHIRYLLDGKFTLEKLNKAVNFNNSNPERKIETLANLTFGEYIRICENEENWELLKLKVDRKIFKDRLDEIRKIRNDVMHFNPDPISEEDLIILRQTSKFFYMLQKM